MILSAKTIRRLKLVDPCTDRAVRYGLSYGLGPASYDVCIDQDTYLGPGDFQLASIQEYVSLPANISAQVADKSSWARRGLSLFNTFIDPGWKGFLTIELLNNSRQPIKLWTGMPIAQIIFSTLDEATEIPYRGKYYNQPSEPVEAILEGRN